MIGVVTRAQLGVREVVERSRTASFWSWTSFESGEMYSQPVTTSPFFAVEVWAVPVAEGYLRP